MRFYILIRGRNCAKYLRKCLNSLKKQTYQDWKALVVLDKPKDMSASRFFGWCGENPALSGRFDLLFREERHGLSRNMYDGCAKLHEETVKDGQSDAVIAILDADDWLRHDGLEHVLRRYVHNRNILVTHGTYIKKSSDCKTRVSRAYRPGENVRTAKWHASHFKTFKACLWPYMKESCFKDKKSRWLPAASDLALMFPLVEMAGWDRVAYVNNRIYYWRDDTPHKTNRDKQLRCEKILRAKKPFRRVTI